MLALVGLNVLGAALFGAVYGLAGARYLNQAAFLAALAGAFALMVVLWVRVEGTRGPGRETVSRLGRVTIGYLGAALAVPMLVLMPLFAVEQFLPAEAIPMLRLGPTMFLVLIGLALTLLVNLAGALVAAGTALVRRARG